MHNSSVQYNVISSAVGFKDGTCTKKLGSALASEIFPFIAWKGTEASVHLGDLWGWCEVKSCRLNWTNSWCSYFLEGVLWVLVNFYPGTCLSPIQPKKCSGSGTKCGEEPQLSFNVSKGEWCFLRICHLAGPQAVAVLWCPLCTCPRLSLMQREAAFDSRGTNHCWGSLVFSWSWHSWPPLVGGDSPFVTQIYLCCYCPSTASEPLGKALKRPHQGRSIGVVGVSPVL